MFTQPWSAVDRKIGLGIALCGLAIALLNSLAFIDHVHGFRVWWVALAVSVPLLQLVAMVGWARMPPTWLRAIWLLQPLLLLVTLILLVPAWDGDPAQVRHPQVWLLDSTVVASAALVLRLRYVLAAALLLAAAVPASVLIWHGTVPPPVLSWGFVHASSIIYVMFTLVLRRQLDRLWRARTMAAQLGAEEQRARAESEEFERFARAVHDEVLSTLGAAIQLQGKPPPPLRQSAAAAVQVLQRDATGSDVAPIELTSEEAGRLIVDLIAAAAPGMPVSRRTSSGRVSSAVAGATGLAAAEAARNAVRHAGGGSGTLAVGDGSIRVAIIDSGPGFDPRHIESGRLGIRESIVRRVDGLDGGRVAIDSGPGGTTVVIAWSRPE